jgi:hypothetical protein
MLNKVAAIGLTLGLALSPMAALAQTGQSAAPAASASHSKVKGSHRTHHRPQLSMHKARAKGTAPPLPGGAKPRS